MYESFYKLTDKPFQLTPDPRFFFHSKGHKRALAYLRYGLSQGEGFIVVTGEVGTGKTLLARTLFDELDEEHVVAGQIVTTQIDADDILRVVAATYGLAHEGISKGTLLKNLETFFRVRTQEGKRMLLVVDEVQNLPEKSLEELRMLSNFGLDGQPILQCFLLGQDEFRHTFQAPGMEQLRQRVIAAYHLGPLKKGETREYIEHRLHTAGWENDPHITDEAFDEIYAFTAGVPRRINNLCDRLLWYGYLEESHTIDHQAVQGVAEEIRAEVMEAGEKAPAPAVSVAAEPQAAQPVSGNLEVRLQQLEKSVQELKKVVRDERVLLRKAILLNLDLDDGGSEPS